MAPREECRRTRSLITRREAIWKDLLKKGAYVVVRAREILSGRESRPLLVLGHMRSGSTLLFHLLIDHLEVAGYGERNQPYKTEADFARLLVDVAYQTGRWVRAPRYAADQINHNRLTPSPELIRSAGASTLLLVRRPDPAIGSMVRVLGRYYDEMTVGRAIAHYRTRLEGLARLSQKLDPATSFFLTYDELLDRTEPVLAELTTFLQLEDRIDDTYDIHPHTGRRGDPGRAIRSGRIVREKPEHRVELEPDVRAQLEECYCRLRDELSRNVTSCGSHDRRGAS